MAPVPEPDSVWLVALGAVVILWHLRKGEGQGTGINLMRSQSNPTGEQLP